MKPHLPKKIRKRNLLGRLRRSGQQGKRNPTEPGITEAPVQKEEQLPARMPTQTRGEK